MKIKSFKKLKENKYKLLLDNDEDITLYDDIIVKYNLLSNKDIDDKKLENIIKQNKQMEAYYLALKMLSNKMRTKKEIAKHLQKHEHNEKTINDVVEKLYKEGYLNDERYINAYISDQVNLSDKGPNKIKRELIDLGFSEDKVKAYLENVDYNLWEEKINKYITKKMKSSSNLSAYKLKNKLVYDLMNKGYYKETVNSIIESFEFKTNPDLIMKEYQKIKKKLELKYEANELNYYIKAKLVSKGFTREEIEKVFEGE